MFDYSVLAIVSALFLMSIPVGLATAIGWCDPTEHKKRPVLFAFSLIFTVLGFIELIKLVGICHDHLTPGQNFLNSATGLFKAIYEIIVDNDMVRFAEDQIHALVFSGAAIVFIVASFIIALIFTYVLVFRIALRIDMQLKNSTRYGFLAACLVMTVLFGVITSQYLIMTLALVYTLLSIGFLVLGNMRLIRSADEPVAEVEEEAPRRVRARKESATTEADLEQEAKEFFGNNDNYKF